MGCAERKERSTEEGEERGKAAKFFSSELRTRANTGGKRVPSCDPIGENLPPKGNDRVGVVFGGKASSPSRVKRGFSRHAIHTYVYRHRYTTYDIYFIHTYIPRSTIRIRRQSLRYCIFDEDASGRLFSDHPSSPFLILFHPRVSPRFFSCTQPGLPPLFVLQDFSPESEAFTRQLVGRYRSILPQDRSFEPFSMRVQPVVTLVEIGFYSRQTGSKYF